MTIIQEVSPATTGDRLRSLRTDAKLPMFRTVVEQGVMPYFRYAQSAVAPVVTVEGRPRTMLASANYLGLATHPAVVEGAHRAVDRFGTTITGSRLLNGTTDLVVQLEEELADWTGRESALVFSSGYAANTGAIAGVVGTGDSIVVDSASHASLLEGCALSGAKTRIFGHNRLGPLREALASASARGGSTLVVVDGLYSMQGDLAPLREIVELADEYGAALMVDEAHALGLLGADLTGTAELLGVADRVDIHMGALSKGLGSVGGYIAGSRELIDHLRINARSLLFTTAAVPASLGAALAAVRLCRTDEGRQLARAALDNAAYLSDALRNEGFAVPPPCALPDGSVIDTPIIPIPIGGDLEAASWWRGLFDRGVCVGVAMHPAVARSRSLLRLCVMATHGRAHLDQVADALVAVRAEVAPRFRAEGTP